MTLSAPNVTIGTTPVTSFGSLSAMAEPVLNTGHISSSYYLLAPQVANSDSAIRWEGACFRCMRWAGAIPMLWGKRISCISYQRSNLVFQPSRSSQKHCRWETRAALNRPSPVPPQSRGQYSHVLLRLGMLNNQVTSRCKTFRMALGNAVLEGFGFPQSQQLKSKLCILFSKFDFSVT